MSILIFKFSYTTPQQVFGKVTRILGSQFHLANPKTTVNTNTVFCNGKNAPSGPGSPHYRGFPITLRHTTCFKTPLDEWSGRNTNLYLTTHSTHMRQTSMTPAGLEPTVPASERPQNQRPLWSLILMLITIPLLLFL